MGALERCIQGIVADHATLVVLDVVEPEAIRVPRWIALCIHKVRPGAEIRGSLPSAKAGSSLGVLRLLPLAVAHLQTAPGAGIPGEPCLRIVVALRFPVTAAPRTGSLGLRAPDPPQHAPGKERPSRQPQGKPEMCAVALSGRLPEPDDQSDRHSGEQASAAQPIELYLGSNGRLPPTRDFRSEFLIIFRCVHLTGCPC